MEKKFLIVFFIFIATVITITSCNENEVVVNPTRVEIEVPTIDPSTGVIALAAETEIEQMRHFGSFEAAFDAAQKLSGFVPCDISSLPNYLKLDEDEMIMQNSMFTTQFSGCVWTYPFVEEEGQHGFARFIEDQEGNIKFLVVGIAVGDQTSMHNTFMKETFGNMTGRTFSEYPPALPKTINVVQDVSGFLALPAEVQREILEDLPKYWEISDYFGWEPFVWDPTKTSETNCERSLAVLLLLDQVFKLEFKDSQEKTDVMNEIVENLRLYCIDEHTIFIDYKNN